MRAGNYKCLQMEQDEVQSPFAKAYQQVCCQSVDSYKTPTTKNKA